jgi:DNA-binding FrmR family transcriptional regulator
MQPETKSFIIARLRSTQNELLKAMDLMQDEESSVTVLLQLNAVSSSLREAGCAVMHRQMQMCLAILREDSCAEKCQAELDKINGLFQFVTKYPSSFKEVD